MKFSFLVPVYNGQLYIEKCLDSLLNQTYKEPYEIIVVDDGSTDDTYKILKKYKKNNSNIRIYHKENEGLSATRNYLVTKCKTEYFIFVDSDDYVDKKLLAILNKKLGNKKVDLLKYQVTLVDVNGIELEKFSDKDFSLTGPKAFESLVKKKNFFDPVWIYAYNREFWNKHNFLFHDKMYHEDFGLTPYVILCAKKIISINFNGYYYVQTDNSIMRTNDEEKEIVKAKHLLILFDALKDKVYKLNLNKGTMDLFNSYIANALLLKANSVPKKYLNEYINEMKKRNVANLLIGDTFIRKVKKILIKYNIKLFVNIERKRNS